MPTQLRAGANKIRIIRMTRARIVVADDIALILSAACSLLRKDHEVVASASNGTAALEAIITFQPEVAVMDISMPGLTGIQVARELQKRSSETAVVFLTAHEEAAIVQGCLEAGGLGYVLKERIGKDLLLAVQEALAGRVFVSQFSRAAR